MMMFGISYFELCKFGVLKKFICISLLSINNVNPIKQYVLDPCWNLLYNWRLFYEKSDNLIELWSAPCYRNFWKFGRHELLRVNIFFFSQRIDRWQIHHFPLNIKPCFSKRASTVSGVKKLIVDQKKVSCCFAVTK